MIIFFQRKRTKATSSSAFIGMDEDDSSESSDLDVEKGNSQGNHPPNSIEDDIIFEEHLLDGLSNWLDRLFEGSTQRYRIQFWPEHMK